MDTHPATVDLATFVRAAKGAPIPDESLVGILTASGWGRRRVYRALGAYYVDALGTALPANAGRAEDAGDAFLYLLNFITLGFWTTALGRVFYVLIDQAFPDPALASPSYHPALVDQLAWPLAAIIVTFPVFALIANRIGIVLRTRADAALSSVRAWLTYLALVLAAIVVLQDGIWFLEQLLRGELSVRFTLDSLVLLVLGGGVFVTYLRGIRRASAG
jgi:hypothetical protein